MAGALSPYRVLDHTEIGPVPYDRLQARLSRTPGWLRDDEVSDLLAAEAVEMPGG